MRSFFIFLTVSLFSVVECGDNGVINFTEQGSRFGDNLVGYFKTRWVSFQYNIPCHFAPFAYANELYIENNRVPQKPATAYKKKIILRKQQESISQHMNCLFYVSFRSKHIDWSITSQDPTFIAFRKELQQEIRPRYTIDIPSIPDNMASVAVHVRRGGGFDAPLLSRGQPYADRRWPLKFPPFKFYIDQIRALYHMLHEKPLYVHIFTDDPQPAHIAKLFEHALDDCVLSFGYRVTGNSHKLNIIDDLFGMTLFDCLIRPNSNFSTCAQLLGDHKIVINPTEYKWKKEQLIITKVQIHTPSIMVSRGNK